MCGVNVTEEGPVFAPSGTQALVPMPPAGAEESFVLPEHGVDLKTLETFLIRQAILRTSGNKTSAGQLLGLSRDQVRYRMEKYGIE